LSPEKDHLVNAEVVDHVGNQESTGGDNGGDHEGFVDLALAGADGGVTSRKENGARAVESGVEGGVGEHGCGGQDSRDRVLGSGGGRTWKDEKEKEGFLVQKSPWNSGI
jgi:hypothetical protein